MRCVTLVVLQCLALGTVSGMTAEEMLALQTKSQTIVATEAARLSDLIEARHASMGISVLEVAHLKRVFSASFQFTIDHALSIFPNDNSTYVTTGDIGQMWLRDSSVQLSCYLPLVKAQLQVDRDSALAAVMMSAMERQLAFINTDIYGSAFTKFHGKGGGDYGPSAGECPHEEDCKWCTCKECFPVCGGYTYQRNFELDSLLNVLLLHYNFWKSTGKTSHIASQTFATALQSIVDVCLTEMNHNTESTYVFSEPIPHAFKDGIGMVWSFARPSDDAAQGYNVPENMMLVVVFNKIHEMLSQVHTLVSRDTVDQIHNISQRVETAIETYGVVTVNNTTPPTKIYAFEVDGYGVKTTLDDANMPNLLWLPFLGYDDKLKLYNNTRKFVLSKNNENYFEGTFASGLGSAHHSFGLRSKNPGMPCRDNCIWHLGLIMQGVTAQTLSEKTDMIKTILKTLADQDLLHEGFGPNDPSDYNRDWFGWADAAFSRWIITDFLQ